MDQIAEYMAKKHRTLADDYRTPDGRYRESCAAIAIDIAERFLAEGKNPNITIIRGRFVDAFNREAISPRPYQGRITWGVHQVCGLDNLVYDPMISPEPVAVKDYCQLAFLGRVEIEVVVPPEKVRDFVTR